MAAVHSRSFARFLILATPAVLAAPMACCRIFDIDATPILGDAPAICGQILDAHERATAEAQSREERRRAADCALQAQAEGRAYVYTYRQLISPDVDLIVQAVAGAGDERLHLRVGNFGREFIRSIEVCTTLTVLPDGRLHTDGCTDWHPLIERLRATPWKPRS